MRKAEKLLSILVAMAMCLTVSAYAGADASVPGGGGRAALSRHAPAAEPTGAPLPDPEPPEDGAAPEADTCEALAVSGGENATLQDQDLTVLGGDPLADGGEGYVNTPDVSSMTAPPWPLGINGGARAIVLSGEAPALSLVRTGVTAAGWGALSADGCSDASVTAVDADLRILSAAGGGMGSGWKVLGYDGDDYGSGYGAYLSSGASAYFYGSTVSGATYGAVLDGADQVWFGSSDGTVLLYDGAALAGSVRGRSRTSVIDSVFGMMMCADAADVTVEDGTAIRAAEAVVLYKDGSGAFTFHNARLSSDSGVLFQMMDSDDDDRIGLLTDIYAFSPVYDEANVGGGPGFPTVERDIVEAVDAKLDDGGDALPPAAEAQHVELTYTNGLYSGNIYNGTGYYGQPGDSLAVTVGRGAVLDGDVSLTSCVKAIPYSREAVKALKDLDGVKYCFVNDIGAPCGEDQAAYIQFLRYTIDQYYLQGHVEDLPYYNGSAAIDVTVAQDGAWAVRSASIVTSLTVEDGGLVYGQVRDNADGSITLLPADQPLEPGVYTSDAAAFAPAESDNGTDAGEALAEAPPRQAVITVGGQEYALDVYERDGAAYVRLTDLIALFFGGLQPPGI